MYIPRRDTNSRVTALAGGRMFPGDHSRSRFEIDERGDRVRVAVASRDGEVRVAVSARASEAFESALFTSVDAAVDFFRRGSLGYSPAASSGRFDGVRLVCDRWEAKPATVEHMASSLFDDESQFPAGTCVLDSGLLMRNLPARWLAQGSLRAENARRSALSDRIGGFERVDDEPLGRRTLDKQLDLAGHAGQGS